jgi:RNA-directed DNA polymerase
MNLESDKRLNIQLRLDFSSAPTGEARQALREDIESLSVVHEPERQLTRVESWRKYVNEQT